MLPEYFAIVGALIASIGGFVYLYETIRGTAKPNRVTWLLWGILPMITFVAQRVLGVQGISWATFTSGFTPILVVVASLFRKEAYWKTKPFDYVCMGLAFCGILLWAITKNPNLAILFSIIADFSAGLPTLIKAYTHPHTESWRAYGLSTIGLSISALAIHTWNFANCAFILYLILMNGAITIIVLSKKPSNSSIGAEI